MINQQGEPAKRSSTTRRFRRPRIRCRFGATCPLHEAIASGNADQIKALLSLGHRFDVKNPDTDETPFHFALENSPAAKRLEILSLSARYGAEVKGEAGAEALKYAAERWQDPSLRGLVKIKLTTL